MDVESAEEDGGSGGNASKISSSSAAVVVTTPPPISSVVQVVSSVGVGVGGTMAGDNTKKDFFDENLQKFNDAFAKLDFKDSIQEIMGIEKMKELQELNNNLESYVSNPKYLDFFASNLPIMLKYLNYGSKNYIREHSDSQLRQLILELLSRFPPVVTKKFCQEMFPILYNILESDNEDNACIAMRILFEFHRRYQNTTEFFDALKNLLLLIKKFLINLVQNVPKLLQPFRSNQIRNSMEEFDLDSALKEIFVSTTLQTGEKQIQTLTLLPRGINSLKLLSEIPQNVVYMSQFFRTITPDKIHLKNDLDNYYVDLLPQIIKVIMIEPTEEQKSNEKFSFETYNDFLLVQVKLFYFITFMSRSHLSKVQTMNIAEKFPKIILRFLKMIPNEMSNLKRDIINSARFLINCEYYREFFVPYVEEFSNQALMIEKTLYVAPKDNFRSLCFSMMFDLIHHLRERLDLNLLNSIVNVYSKNLYDDSSSLTIHMMFCRLLASVNDSFLKQAEKEKCLDFFIQALFRMLETYSDKICSMAKYSIPRIKKKLELQQQQLQLQQDKQQATDNNNNENQQQQFLNEDLFINYQNLNFGLQEQSLISINDCRHLGKYIINGLKIYSNKLNEFSKRYEFTEFQLNKQQQQQSGGGQIKLQSIKAGYCRSKDIDILIKLFKNGVKFLEIYNNNKFPSNQLSSTSTLSTTIPSSLLNNNNRLTQLSSSVQQSLQQQQQYAKTKDERDMIDQFASIFTCLSTQTFRVVIKSNIEFFVQSIHENYNMLQLPNCFLSQKNISSVFGEILTNYLVEKMEIMGHNSEMSNLFLKLFKLIFGSVSLLQIENEKMLQPYLRKLVNNSMRMAMTAQDPYNYFMLLRALFRSIGGGTHDQLYREFLPMLPSLLEGLNNFQTGIHRQNMKDVFVELCLTIPVRLSSLLPYLPYLMDPLVSALKGAPSLISQGLRTLELCVDNLQPDFLHAHFEPIRIELMQSLWKILRCPNDNIAQISLRILGKLGGTNHRMMIEPQKLDYIEFRDPFQFSDDSNLDSNSSFMDSHQQQQSSLIQIPTYGSCSFIEMKFDEFDQRINLPVDKIIESAYQGLRSSTLDDFYREKCWLVIKGFLIANMENLQSDIDEKNLFNLFSHKSFKNGQNFGYLSITTISSTTTTSFSTTNQSSSSTSSASGSGSGSSSSIFSNSINFYKYPDEKLRKIHELALTALLTASAASKKMLNEIVKFMIELARHYTLVAICQQSGPINISGRPIKLHGMDPLVLFDAITAVMGQEEKELFKPCHLVLDVIIDAAENVVGKDRTCQLPFFDYFLERVCALCYERAWYSKYGGCTIVSFLFKRMSLKWLLSRQFFILKAMLFVMMDLSNDLSSGVIEMAKDNLEQMIKICFQKLEETETTGGSTIGSKDLLDLQQKSKNDIVQELLRQITCSNTIVREQAMHLLEVLAKTIDSSVTEVIRPHKEILEDMVPFKKLRLFQQPVEAQIGILDGNTFCISLEPQLFVIDITIHDHLNFFNDVFTICDLSDIQLKKDNPCYKSITESLTPLKKAALRTLSSCQHLKHICDKVFHVLYKALISPDDDLQACAYDCMKNYKFLKDISPETIRTTVRSFLMNINDMFKDSNLKELKYIQRLKNLARLFTYLFNDKFCQHMLQYLNRITDICLNRLQCCREKEYEIRLKASAINNNPTNTNTTTNTNEQQNQQNDLAIKLAQLLPLSNSATSSLNVGAEIIYLFCEISAADSSYIEVLFKILIKAETTLDIHVYMIYYKPLLCFIKRYPKEAIQKFEQYLNDEIIFRFYLWSLKQEDGQSLRQVFYDNPQRLCDLLLMSGSSTTGSGSSQTSSSSLSSPMDQQQQQQSPQQQSIPSTPPESSTTSSAATSPQSPRNLSSTATTSTLLSLNPYTRYQILKIIYILMKNNLKWLPAQQDLVRLLKILWLSESFHKYHCENHFHYQSNKQREEPKLLIKLLLNYLQEQKNLQEFELYFQLLRSFIGKYRCDFEFLHEFFEQKILKNYSIEWKREAFLKYCQIFPQTSSRINGIDLSLEWPQFLKAKILQLIIIPIFASVFKNGQTLEFLGPPVDDQQQPQPSQDSSTSSPESTSSSQSSKNNLIVIFLNVLVKDTKVDDCVQTAVIQLACLIVEHASNYLRPSQQQQQLENDRFSNNKNKKQNAKEVRVLLQYIWPQLGLMQHQTKRHDTVKKYYCYLLMAHIISKISIHKNIIKQILPNLLKGYYQESKQIVFTALEILIPVLPQRIKNGYQILRQLTKKFLIEDSHIHIEVQHLLLLIIRYYKIYYPSRNLFIPHMITTMNKLFTLNNFTLEYRKFTLDLIEVIILWEQERLLQLQQQQQQQQSSLSNQNDNVDSSDSESSFDSKQEPSSNANQSSTSSSKTSKSSGSSSPSIEKEHGEAIITFLIRFICSAYDSPPLSQQQQQQQLQLQQSQQSSSTSTTINLLPIEIQCRRAFQLLKDILQKEFWPIQSIKYEIIKNCLLKPIQTINQQQQAAAAAANPQNKSSPINPNLNKPTSLTPSQLLNPSSLINLNNNICMALELLLLFLQTLKMEQAIQTILPLQQALITCLEFNCLKLTNLKVIQSFHNLLLKLMSIIPPKSDSSTISPKSGQTSKTIPNDQLECFEPLYLAMHHLILNRLKCYNRIDQTTTTAAAVQIGPNQISTTGMAAATMASPSTVHQQQQQILQQQQMNRGQGVGGGIPPNMIPGAAVGPGGIPGVLPGSPINVSGTPQSSINSINQQQATATTLPQLYSVLMCLKAACLNEPIYIERVITPFSVMFTRLAREHINWNIQHHHHQQQSHQQSSDSNLYVENINLSLDLIKNRIGTLNPDYRRPLINVVLQLIEKSPDSKVMRQLLTILDQWIKQSGMKPLPSSSSSSSSNNSSNSNKEKDSNISPKDKSNFLYKIGQHIEKRFKDDQDLIGQYLDLVHYIYSDDQLRTSELVCKLEFAFMLGLRSPQPNIRQKFFQIQDKLKRSPYDRIMHIITAQNWETIGTHYWIKQAIELLLSTTSRNERITNPNNNSKLPLPTSLISLSEPKEKSSLLTTIDSLNTNNLINQSMDILMSMDLSTSTTTNDVEMKSISDSDPEQQRKSDVSGPDDTSNNTNNKSSAVALVAEFLKENNYFESWKFFDSVAQLCHLDNQLAHHIWIQLFPRLYGILNSKQKIMVATELAPFFASGSHQYQRETKISSLNTFFEAVAHCDPPIRFRPILLRYLSKTHNVWHRAALILESGLDSAPVPAMGMGALVTMDGSVGLVGSNHQNHSLSSSTTTATPTTTTMGQKHTRKQMGGDKHHHNQQQQQQQINGLSNPNLNGLDNNNWTLLYELPTQLSQPYNQECMSALADLYEILKEQDYWAGIWHKRKFYDNTLVGIAYEQQGFFEQAKGAYELAMSEGTNHYSNVTTTGGVPKVLHDEFLLWERHWIRCSKELNQWDFLLEYGSSPTTLDPFLVLESAWRIPDWNSMNQALSVIGDNFPRDYAWKMALYKGYNSICNVNHHDIDNVEQMVELAASFLLNEWRSLPEIVSSAHVSILQGAHQVIELQEACNFHQMLFQQPTNFAVERSDVRSIIKTWKNRLPIIADDLSHWSDIFTWRQHHYQAIVTRFEPDIPPQTPSQQTSPGGGGGPQPTTPQQSNALCGAHASAQSLIHLAKVARKHSLINVALDQLNRIHTIPKVPIMDCFQKIRQQLKCYLLKYSIQPNDEELQEAMSVIECTHLNYFQSEMIAEFIALKGYVLMKMKKMEEANKNFSASLQINDITVKSWAMWAEFNYELFLSSCKDGKFAQRNMQYGVDAIISYLHAVRVQNESKSRKYLSHVLWLLSYDEDNRFAKTIETYNTGVPASNWAPWINQLLQCLLTSNSSQMALQLISHIGKSLPEAVYYPTRTLYLSLKMEARELKFKLQVFFATTGLAPQQPNREQSDQVLASSALWRCTRVMHHTREFYPTLLTTIEGLLDQIMCFRENPLEDILRQLRQALAKCYTIAYENRDNVSETLASNHTINYIRKLVNTFGFGIDNAAASTGINASSSGSSSGGGSSAATGVSSDSPIHHPNVMKTQRFQNLNTTASETFARRAQSIVQDPDFQKMKQQFTNDFDFINNFNESKKLHNLIVKLKKWIKILEAKIKLQPKSWLLEEKCRYISNFSKQIAEIAIPGEFFFPKISKFSIVHIDRFMPRVEIVPKHNTTARRLFIRGHNGKIYPYLVITESSFVETRREERVLQLLRFLNLYLTKHKETSRRVLNFTVPRVVPFCPTLRFVEDNISSLSLIEIYKQHMIRRGSDPDAPIAKYYDRLLSIQTKLSGPGSGSGPAVQHSHLKEIVEDIQSSMAPNTLLKEWAMQTFSTATDFWHFRKQFTTQLALAGLCEYAFHLIRLNPDMMYIHRDSGLMNISYFKFDLDEEKGELINKRLVPFRLTHSIQNLITEIGIQGPLKATMISTASCLVHPNWKVQAVLLAIFRDEIAHWFKRIKSSERMAMINAAIATHQMNQQQQNKSTLDPTTQPQIAEIMNLTNLTDIPEMKNEELVNLVSKGVQSIMSRLQNLSTFDHTGSFVSTLIKTAIDSDNLCQIDPAWHPWL